MNFRERVIALVCTIPRGKVASYGQVAAALGSPRSARQVGWAMHSLDGDTQTPWWRVINSEGRISIKGNFLATATTQKKLLEDEGVVVSGDYKILIEHYRHTFRPSHTNV